MKIATSHTLNFFFVFFFYSKIPVSYLQGSIELLSPTQLEFLIKRVEHFMKDLDIPALSIAIVKKERLKFAAGYQLY